VLKIQRAATLEATETRQAGKSSNEAIVADIEAVASPLLIMDKVLQLPLISVMRARRLPKFI